MSVLDSTVGTYDLLRICANAGARLVMVQFDGIGTIAGPPARMTGTALVNGSIIAIR